MKGNLLTFRGHPDGDVCHLVFLFCAVSLCENLVRAFRGGQYKTRSKKRKFSTREITFAILRRPGDPQGALPQLGDDGWVPGLLRRGNDALVFPRRNEFQIRTKSALDFSPRKNYTC